MSFQKTSTDVAMVFINTYLPTIPIYAVRINNINYKIIFIKLINVYVSFYRKLCYFKYIWIIFLTICLS